MKKIILVIGLLFIPAFSYAVDFSGFISNINEKLIPPVFSLLIIMAMTFFAYNAVFFIWGERDKAQRFRDRLLWSLIAIFVIFSIWGIIAFFQNSFPSLKQGPENFNFESDYLGS